MSKANSLVQLLYSFFFFVVCRGSLWCGITSPLRGSVSVVDSGPRLPCGRPGVTITTRLPALIVWCGFECDSFRRSTGVYMTSPMPCLIKMLQPHTFALVALDVGLGIIIRLRRMWA